MKRHLLYIIALWSLACMVSCHRHYQYPPVLQEEAHALYEQSKEYEANHDIEKQIDCLIKAYGLLPQFNDPTFASKVCQALGSAYMFRDLYEQSIAFLREGIEYALLEKPQGIQLSQAYSKLGRTYATVNNPDSAEHYFQLSLQQAKALEDSTEIGVGFSQLGAIYEMRKDFEKSIEYEKQGLDIYIQHGDSDYIPQSYYGIGSTYYYMNELDSARSYFEKALHTDNIYTVQGAYQALYHIHRKQGNLAEAIEYNQISNHLKDSIASIARDDMLAEMQMKYDNEKLVSEQRQQKLHIAYLIIALVLVGGASLATISFNQYRLKRNERKLQKAFLELQENKQSIRQNRIYIESITQELENTEQLAANQIKELTEQLTNLEQDNERLQTKNKKLEDIISQTEKHADQTINRMISQNKLLHKQNDSLHQFFEQHYPLLKELHEHPHPVKNWQDIYTITDIFFDSFYSRLKHDLPGMPEYSLQVCCLVKHGFTTPQIASIVGIASNSLSKQKGRIRNMMVERRPDIF
ncbi:MAG: tetratricopeptide repeat protein, partial [Bacteroidaceae bacterium]|nr:tetratricopeptide repeat protein [Bacteroidaceae bacterium]